MKISLARKTRWREAAAVLYRRGGRCLMHHIVASKGQQLYYSNRTCRRTHSATIKRNSRTHRLTLRASSSSVSVSAEESDDDSNNVWHAERSALEPARLKRPPEIYETTAPETLLFQFGEGMRRFEVPAGTRVVYPGLRKDGENDITKVRTMVRHALDNPVGDIPFRQKLAKLLRKKGTSAKILFAFDDVSLPLPPMRSPDIRRTVLEICEEMCVEMGFENIDFVCSIALHRFLRPDEFRHICGPRLYNRYFPLGRMYNFNAVDEEFSTHLGYTRHGEDVQVCKAMVEAALAVYVNVNYVSMDGGYKSYATGMVHYNSLKHNHDSKTLRDTKSLYDPENSKMHKSFERIGKMMQKQMDIFHIETVLDEQLFPFYLSWITVLDKRMNLLQQAAMRLTCFSLRFVPQWLRMRIWWSPLVRGQFGLLEVNAGETVQVHQRTLAANYRDKVLEVEGQCDILILAPTALGPYTKDCYMNPLLVNTYALGYWYNMYIEGKALLREGGVAIVVSPMEYNFSSPAHDGYKELFEEVLAKEGGLENFEDRQEEFMHNERLNDIYRQGRGPAGVHGFYMFTWAAHGMDKIAKVFVVGAKDRRGPDVLQWEMAPSIPEAVERAREFLQQPNAKVTYWRCPPVGYARVVDAKQEKEDC